MREITIIENLDDFTIFFDTLMTLVNEGVNISLYNGTRVIKIEKTDWYFNSTTGEKSYKYTLYYKDGANEYDDYYVFGENAHEIFIDDDGTCSVMYYGDCFHDFKVDMSRQEILKKMTKSS